MPETEVLDTTALEGSPRFDDKTSGEQIWEDLVVDPEFKKFIPPLAEAEYLNLEKSIENEGCRDAIVVWVDEDKAQVIVDGHNRYEICKRHRIPFRKRRAHFLDRDHVKRWMLENQSGRRNLNQFCKARAALQIFDQVKIQLAKVKAAKEAGVPCEYEGAMLPIEYLAKISGVATGTLKHVKKLLEIATPEELGKLESGTLGIRTAYDEHMRPGGPQAPAAKPPVETQALADDVPEKKHDGPPQPGDPEYSGEAGIVDEDKEAKPPAGPKQIQGEPAPPAAPKEEEMTDEDWLAGLPLNEQLSGPARQDFRMSALFYRENVGKIHELRKAVQDFRRQFSQTGKLPYLPHNCLSVGNIPHPSTWSKCGSPTAGCNGTGYNPKKEGSTVPVGACNFCYGRGYFMGKPRTS